jgi:hypothetical protein
MEVVCSSEASMYLNWNTRRQNAEDRALHSDRCENLKSNRESFPFVRGNLFVFFFSVIFSSVKRVEGDRDVEIQRKREREVGGCRKPVTWSVPVHSISYPEPE